MTKVQTSGETTVEFEDLPPEKKPRRPWANIAAALRARPGDWARVASYPHRTSASNAAYRIRSAANTEFAPAGAFEAASRPGDGEFRLYVRFVGHRDGLS